MAISQRDGFITGLEGTPILLSTDAGKLRLYSVGPATGGICGVLPADPVIPETINRSYKRLVLNDLVQFFRNCRTFKIEKNGDNRYAFFAYDTPEVGSAQVLPTVVTYVKPFHSLTNVGEGVGAFNTMLYLAQYIPDNANLWGNSKTGQNLDADFNTSIASSTFCFDYGVSTYEDPFIESVLQDSDAQLSLTPIPRITISGKGKNVTFINGLSFNLSVLSVELKDLTLVGGNITFNIGNNAEIIFNNVRVIGGINIDSEGSVNRFRGNLEYLKTNGDVIVKYIQYTFNNLTATKLVSNAGYSTLNTISNGFGFYRYIDTTDSFQEIGYWGDSTARENFNGLLE